MLHFNYFCLWNNILKKIKSLSITNQLATEIKVKFKLNTINFINAKQLSDMLEFFQNTILLLC